MKGDIEKDKLYKTLEKVDKLSDHQIGLLIICIILLAACMGFDAAPCPYCTIWIERLFTYDIGNVIAIIVVIWTFTVSLSVFCLEKLGERYYGIQIIDVLSFELKRKGLFALAGMVLAELFALILAAILEWEITIAMIALQQFFIMIYIFLFVCIKTSYRHILKQIKEEMKGLTKEDLTALMKRIEDIKWRMETCEESADSFRQPMLFKMVRNLDYTDFYGTEALLSVLRESSDKLSKLFLEIKSGAEDSQQDEGKQDEETFKFQHCMIVFSKEITLDIIRTGKTKDDIMDFLYNWINTKELRLEIKQGIIAALMEELTPQNVTIYQNLIKAEIKHQRELQIWSAVYNIYKQEQIDEEWRALYTMQQFKRLRSGWKQEDSENAIKYWEMACGNKGRYTPIFEYIF